MYATGEGPDDAVKVEAARPPFAENQKVRISRMYTWID